MVRADYAGARLSCERLAPRVSPVVGAACRAQVDAANAPARQVYFKLGFQDGYTYHYRSSNKAGAH
jgi:hypothetical protein